MFYILRMAYRQHKITAAQVWEKADEGVITAAQAAERASRLCGDDG